MSENQGELQPELNEKNEIVWVPSLFNCTTSKNVFKYIKKEIKKKEQKIEESKEEITEETQEEKNELDEEIIEKEVTRFEDLALESRNYNIDITAKLQFSCGEEISTLISSNVSRYLEFKTIENTYLFSENELQLV